MVCRNLACVLRMCASVCARVCARMSLSHCAGQPKYWDSGLCRWVLLFSGSSFHENPCPLPPSPSWPMGAEKEEEGRGSRQPDPMVCTYIMVTGCGVCVLPPFGTCGTMARSWQLRTYVCSKETRRWREERDGFVAPVTFLNDYDCDLHMIGI